ncbi:MAG: glycosyltransferase [Planctomycetota bacterium]|nr:glycosyltransferase [Planctomycetota bacterium]
MPSPRISLVIPAWNEQAYLPRLLDTVDAARARYRGGPDAVEVIVADNGSTDATAKIAETRGCRVAPVARRRIACARNGGAAVARGAILSFVDADMRIHPETFNAIDEAMNTGRYVGGATGVRVERMSLGIAATVVAILPMIWLTGVDAGVWFCRRADFDEVGGYDEALPVTEDVRFLWALKRLGRRRRPKEKLARLSSWGSFWRTFRGLPADGAAEPAVDGVRAIVSFRKFDKHGDWHFLRDFVCMVFWLFFSRRRFNAHVQRYWYEDAR